MKYSNEILKRCICTIGMICLFVVHVQAQERFSEYDLRMYKDPELSLPQTAESVFPPGLVELWLKALERPDTELRRLVIDSLAMAKKRGLNKLGIAAEQLIAIAKSEDAHVDVLRATANTMAILDMRNEDELLASMALKHGAQISEIVEPTLASWKSSALQKAWLERLAAQTASPEMMIFAIQGVAELESPEATVSLQSIARNRSELYQLRLAAARGLSMTAPHQQLEFAKELLAIDSRNGSVSPILALAAIDRDDSAESIALLQELVANDSSVVQSEALGHLYRIDYKLVEPYCDSLVTSPDVNVRRWCVKTLIDGKKIDQLPLIASVLNDVNPTLRRFVSSALVKFGQDKTMLPSVIAATQVILDRNDWQGCEQACVVLAKLDFKPSGPRMVELLGHPRGDVQVASAWGLTQLRLPKLLPEMLDHAESIYEGFQSGTLNGGMPGVTTHMAHLFTAFGDQKFLPAEPLIMKYIPKNHSLGYESRAAAAWAIGNIYEGNSKDSLVPILLGRLRDGGSMEPESQLMCQMSANALGKMKSRKAVGGLKEYANGSGFIGATCRWAVKEITGEEIPAPAPPNIVDVIDDWFLTPLPQN